MKAVDPKFKSTHNKRAEVTKDFNSILERKQMIDSGSKKKSKNTETLNVGKRGVKPVNRNEKLAESKQKTLVSPKFSQAKLQMEQLRKSGYRDFHDTRDLPL